MLRIGEFSRLSRVPTTVLRYYDERGLLRPMTIDAATGYRYYSVAQLPRLNRILALKDLGLSLEQISCVLNERLPADQLRGMLRLRQLEQQERVREEQARLYRVEARLAMTEQEECMSSYEVVLKSVPAQRAATRRAVLDRPSDQAQLFQDIESTLARHTATASGFPFAIYHDIDYRESNMDIEVGIPTDAPLPSDDPTVVQEIDGIDTAACVVHEGPYEELHAAYNAVLTWIEANNYRLSGPCREVNLRFGTLPSGFTWADSYLTNTPTEYVTEIQVPVERAS